jgi:adenine C2-methylase RlmN of 23S rRNA A2503 and tRNA A37
LSKDRKDHTEIELVPIGYASARNAENRTKLDSIVRSLTNNKRLRACSYFNEKSRGKNISEKYSMLPLNKLHLIKEITINLIIFYL